MNPVDQFHAIARSATDRLAETFNAPDLIPYGKAMLELVSQHPGQRQAFARAFVQGIRDPERFDLWLIQFCVHALRWAELKSEFEAMSAEAVAQNDWNMIQPLGHVLDAFEDNWKAREFYAEYFRPHGTY